MRLVLTVSMVPDNFFFFRLDYDSEGNRLMCLGLGEAVTLPCCVSKIPAGLFSLCPVLLPKGRESVWAGGGGQEQCFHIKDCGPHLGSPVPHPQQGNHSPCTLLIMPWRSAPARCNSYPFSPGLLLLAQLSPGWHIIPITLHFLLSCLDNNNKKLVTSSSLVRGSKSIWHWTEPTFNTDFCLILANLKNRTFTFCTVTLPQSAVSMSVLPALLISSLSRPNKSPRFCLSPSEDVCISSAASQCLQ